MNFSTPSFIEIELTMALPCTHFSPASMTANFEESIITGTRAMSGSAATRLRNSTIAFCGIEQAFVHVDVDDLRAHRDLIARDIERGGKIAFLDQLAELGRAGDIGALADIDEGNVGRERERLEAGQAAAAARSRGSCAARPPSPVRRWREYAPASCRSSRRRC